jgi:hypothetical protein
MRNLVALLLLVCPLASANPFVARGVHVWMSAEKLSIIVSPSNASISGTFSFQLESGQKWSPVIEVMHLEIPIWLPDQSFMDPLVAAFWRELEESSTAAETLNAFGHLTELHASVGGHRLSPKRVRAYNPGQEDYFLGSFRPEKPKALEEPGFRCVLVDFPFSSNELHLNPQTVINAAVSYHQPLSGPKGDGRLFYVPFFVNQPPGAETTDTNRYSIRITCSADNPLKVTNGEQKLTVGSQESVSLSPVHCQPIRVSARPRVNGQAALDAGILALWDFAAVWLGNREVAKQDVHPIL